jgi:hypothetical protein
LPDQPKVCTRSNALYPVIANPHLTHSVGVQQYRAESVATAFALTLRDPLACQFNQRQRIARRPEYHGIEVDMSATDL